MNQGICPVRLPSFGSGWFQSYEHLLTYSTKPLQRRGCPQNTVHWFISSYTGRPSSAELRNLRTCAQCFELIDPQYSLSTVRARPDVIVVPTPTGRVRFEH